VAWLAHVAAYEPGSFFRRELPATRAVLDGVQDLGLLVVDGYVDLDPDGRPGLGAHVHDENGGGLTRSDFCPICVRGKRP
jgi:deoxyribonuclease V